jgi:hypothetical protein
MQNAERNLPFTALKFIIGRTVQLKFRAFFFILMIAVGKGGYSQQVEQARLFESNEPLEIKLSYSFKSISKNKIDSVYYPAFLHYKSGDSEWDSIKVNLQARGNFRRNHCAYAPLRIETKKKHNKGTIFEGHNSLKLVLPCLNSKNNNDLILKEFLCYQFYEVLTPISYNSRLANINLENLDDKRTKGYELKAFFIEDNGSLANRNDGEITKRVNISPFLLQDTTSVRLEFFQFMIANTDWSMVTQHNVRLVGIPSRGKFPVPYDFDMAGFVNAPYSQVNELIPISNVTERWYRGMCRDEGLLEYVRREYILREAEIMEAFRSIETQINPKEISGMKKYMEEFFSILKDDRKYNYSILKNCRTL